MNIDTASDRTIRACLLIIATIAVTVALIYTRDILVPFVIALFWYALLTPIILWLQTRWKLPRSLSLILTALFFLAISALLFFLVSSSLQKFLQSANTYRDQMLVAIEWSSDKAVEWGLPIDRSLLNEGLKKLPVLQWVQTLTTELVRLAGSTTLVIIFVLFLLTGEPSSKSADSFVNQIISKVSRFVATKSLISLITGILVGVILVIGRIELVFMFAALTVLLNFIPNVGSLLATLLPLPIILLQYGISWQMFVIIGLLGTTQFLLGNILEPKIMGESLDLHPVTILLFLMFWGLVWGIAGMFLAVPITAVLKIILNRIKSARPLAELMAGRLSIG